MYHVCLVHEYQHMSKSFFAVSYWFVIYECMVSSFNRRQLFPLFFCVYSLPQTLMYHLLSQAVLLDISRMQQ